MLRRLDTQCLLSPADVEPSVDGMEVVGAFNPGVAEHNGDVVLLVRVAERVSEKRPGYRSSPRFVPGNGLVIDWWKDSETLVEDSRVIKLRESGNLRLTSCSHVRVFRTRYGRKLDFSADALFTPQSEFEEYGIEDPRVTKIDDVYYITYVAVSRHGACTCLASTSDFKEFRRHGIVFPSENKDVLLFPQTFDGQYVAIHRPNPRYHFSAPEMWLARSPDLVHWGQHAILHSGRRHWESGRVGGGAPPLRTKSGWLVVYHGSLQARDNRVAGDVGEYGAGAMLLDLDDPARVIGNTREPFMTPEFEFEKSGFVNNVVFPTGVVTRDDRVQIYYGAADTCVGLVEFERGGFLSNIEVRDT